MRENQGELLEVKALRDMSELARQEGRGRTFEAEGTVCSEAYKVDREPQGPHSA